MSTKSGKPRSLAERHTDLTRRLIEDAALDALAEGGVDALVNRGIAERAGISERTMYRYFSTRDALLDAVAAAYSRKVEMPAAPATLEALARYPTELYERYEATRALTMAALHPDLFERIRTTLGSERWQAMNRLIDTLAPQRSEAARRQAAANIRYFLSATAWNYYRHYFNFPLDEAAAAVSAAILAVVRDLGTGAPSAEQRPARSVRRR